MTDYKNTLLYKKIIDITVISEASLEKLFKGITVRRVEKNEIVLEEGKICKNIFFVESGYLRIFVYKDGEEINTDFIFENNFATNLKSLRFGVPSTSTIQAGENSVIYVFEKNKMLDLYNESPEIESFGRTLLERLLITQEEHTNLFKIFTPTERYEYLQKNQPLMIRKISISQIASYLGIARETLSRIRKIK